MMKKLLFIKSCSKTYLLALVLTGVSFLSYGQIVQTFTSPTANSLGATAWAANTAYSVNQYVHVVDNTGTTPPYNRLYKVTTAGTSNTLQPTGSADFTTSQTGAAFSYMGIIPLSSTWTCPAGVTSIQVECWGGGGAGGSAATASSSGNRSGGGGGAGSYVKQTITVVPGTVYNLIVGVGGYKGATSAASGYYGNVGGKSEFSGGTIAALTASGGTGGTGAGASNLINNPGGVLGGVYGCNVFGSATNYTGGVASFINSNTGANAVPLANVSSGGAVTYIAFTNQGTGYTSNPTVSVSNGSGQTFVAFANPNINSTGAEITTTLGSNGAVSSSTAGGAGGASPDGLAGGAGGTGTSIGGYVGATATNPGAGGGGGFSFYATPGTNASGAGGAGANGKVVITYTAPITTYTYTGTGDLHDVANWKDGSNNTPANFTADFQIFKINSNATTTAPWTVSGAASKIVIGDASTTNVSLIIASGFGITAPMDVTDGNKVYVQDVIPVATTFSMNHPTFGTLGATSEVHYQNNTINDALVKTGFTYGKLYVDGTGSGLVFFSGAVNPTNHNVVTLFEVAAGSKAFFSETSYYYMSLNAGAQANIYGTLKVGKVAGFVSSSVGTASSTFGSLQFIGTESLTLGANSIIEFMRASSTSTQTITPRTDYKNLVISGLDNNKSFTGATTVSGTLTVNITGTSTLAATDNITAGSLVLTAGKLTIPSAKTLTISSGGTFTGGSSTSFINTLGKVNISGVSVATSIPVGYGANYLPVTLTPANASDFSINVFNGATTDATSTGTAISDKTNIVDAIWNVSRSSGTGNCAVTLAWPAALEGSSFTALADNQIGISQYTGGSYSGFAGTGDNTANTASYTFADNTFGPLSVGTIATQPVKLTSFAASKQGAAVQLKWTTASEQNNAYFDVQRSSDGQTFTTIGTKAGAGNSHTVLDYFFTDRKPAAGLNYYRLNQVDADGKSTLSNPVALDFGFDGASMVVYTTKNVSVLSVNIKAEKASTGKFVVYNVAGQKMLEQAISLNLGSNDLGINLPDLKKGIYVAAFQSGNQILTQKFIR